MFTGIVEETGVVESIKKKKNLFVLVLTANKVLAGTKIGDSISVDGVCLTVTAKKGKSVSFDLMKETLDATSLGKLKAKSSVNLERALKMNARIGGHFVSGHVDGIGIIKNIVLMENYVEYQISIDKSLMKYVVPKGSICIDGISLTVGAVKKRSNMFSVYLIPHTLEITTLGNKKKLDKVNIETDILAKYVLEGRFSK